MTVSDQRLYERWAAGETLEALGKEIGLSREGVRLRLYAHARRQGLPCPPVRPLPDRAGQAARLRREERLSWALIGQRLQVTDATAKAWAERQAQRDGLPLPGEIIDHRTRRGAATWAACYELRRSGLSWADVCARTGIPHNSTAIRQARRHAQRQGLPWPIPVGRRLSQLPGLTEEK